MSEWVGGWVGEWVGVLILCMYNTLAGCVSLTTKVQVGLPTPAMGGTVSTPVSS